MNYNLFITVLVVIAFAVAGYFVYRRLVRLPTKSKNAEVVEFEDEPDDSDTPITNGELEDVQADLNDLNDFEQDPQAYSYAYEAGAIRGPIPDDYVDSVNLRTYTLDLNDNGLLDEDFRIHRSGGGSGPRIGSGVRGGSGMGGMGGMGPRPGRPGRPGRRHRRWPIRRGRRPFRPYYWRRFPYYTPFYYYSYPYYSYDYGYSYATPQVQRYSVRIMDKQSTHPYFGRGSPKGYSIIGAEDSVCGISGGKLVLQRGRTYEFDIFTGRDCVTRELEQEPFFFTTNPVGGNSDGNIFGVTPTVNGVLRITVDESVPKQFFYQSTNNKFVGGIVEIV